MIVRPILESMLEEIKFESLPSSWSSLDVESFSRNKKLWDFQQNAVKNAIKCLYLFYKQDNGDKSKFYQRYVLNGLDEDLQDVVKINTSKLKRKVAEILSQYYPIEDEIIKFENFINRAAFWMATGSGKTLVIVKLIEALKKLMDLGEIPKKDILFLTHREDLINQFKKHVEEFNELSVERCLRINLRSLGEYEKIKRESLASFFNEIIVFYYKADCITDEQKEKLIDFRNYENGGNWYIILDEAHKGDKDESKRQFFYSIMSRNGFLFNFSATFIDERDILTTAFNFNLERFISEGYGKHIYILKQEVRAFKEKEDYNRNEKKKVVLKTLILLTYVKKFREKIKEIDLTAYHEPLMLTLVNTVNLSEVREEEPDLKLFFNELESIGKGEVDKNLLKESIEEIIQEFSDNPLLIYENIPIKINKNIIQKITLNDILYHIYNSETPGKIEALTIPEKRQEVVLKLKTSDKPFALIKIGDAIRWIKDNLRGYEVNESYEDRSIFENIEEREEINILMGSRAFYEGWDSNRPNLILFINIGVGKEAKKFVIQSIGRGVRIEPIKNKRKRLKHLFNKGEDNGLFTEIGDESLILPLETLFIFGTNRSILTEVVKYLEIKKELEATVEVELNPKTELYTLLIPVYKNVGKLYKQREPQKFILSESCLNFLNEYFNTIDERILVVFHEIEPEILQHLKSTFLNKDRYYNLVTLSETLPVNLIISKLIKHFNINFMDLDKFKKLEDEIVHFKKIKIFFKKHEEQREFEEKIIKVKKYREKFKEEKQLEKEYGKIPKNEYDKRLNEISKKYSKEENFKDLKIKFLAEHYYNPLILSLKEKVDYIKHIIKTPSEANFLDKLEKFIENNENKLNVDWWLFSKIDEHLDKIYIPYYDPETNQIREFCPDFIFWFKKGEIYHIVFVDPKSIKQTEFEHKVDGFKKIFEENNLPKVFRFGDLKVIVTLHLFTEDVNNLSEGYKKYWFDRCAEIFAMPEV
ncbi:MAG: DEAD/DEAH box helicase family protein [Candidatus Pacearchaeota archaeon]|nr:DEAD/DEAH box helicase family protein [Candidatus Pacearchaeota archaeon]